MAVSEYKTGTKLVSTAEWSLVNDSAVIATDTTAGVFQCFIDVNAIAAADEFRFRIYEKTRGADTQRQIFEAAINGPQSQPIWVSAALMLKNGWDFTLLKIAGTDRTITWSIRKA
jgi:hypothetical protein